MRKRAELELNYTKLLLGQWWALAFYRKRHDWSVERLLMQGSQIKQWDILNYPTRNGYPVPVDKGKLATYDIDLSAVIRVIMNSNHEAADGFLNPWGNWDRVSSSKCLVLNCQLLFDFHRTIYHTRTMDAATFNGWVSTHGWTLPCLFSRLNISVKDYLSERKGFYVHYCYESLDLQTMRGLDILWPVWGLFDCIKNFFGGEGLG